ncbi:MAG: class I SAM-dependent methyltransferase [Gammaproteobacteria bacterium]|jgi:SAM-dependent methyltransferase|nr:class I SAM-dependent methyltransferase [Bacteroidetes Order II. bacterium]MBT6585658.1 class I SAM-dependent methyltransferase [Gammaproteobacteria bacterium]MBT7878883.1 class I SAM-dependent methyltransferase [Gammaproteobacteria bacterium]
MEVAPNMYREVLACPVCDCQKGKRVSGLAGSFVCSDVASLLHPEYTIVECSTCDLYYKSNVFNTETLDEYYAHLDVGTYDQDYGYPTDRELLKELRRLCVGGRVLDYGCSTGRVLGMLGESYHRVGVEVNQEAAKIAVARGITILDEYELFSERCAPFDAIILSDVYEHLLSPMPVVMNLKSKLVPGGKLILVTGFADSVISSAYFGEHWYFRVGGHLQMAGLKHLQWVAEKLGLKVEKMLVMSHYKRVILKLLKQNMQALLYRLVRRPGSKMSSILSRLPVVGRAGQWNNLPATDQRKDHVFVVFSNE